MTFQNDFGRLDRDSYCAIVLWLSGFSTDTIAAIVNITSGKVRGLTRSRANGGKMPKVRDDLSKEQRQELLNDLKSNRLDDDFLKPFCFLAHDLNPNQATRQGRKEATSFRKEVAMMAADAEDKRRAREHGLNERRGDRAHPIVFLERAKLLDDPEDAKSTEKISATMRRVETAKWLRSNMEAAEISGFKNVNLELTSGGGGFPINERIVAALIDLRAVKAMAGETLYTTVLVPVVLYDSFIWEVPSKQAREIVLEDIRRAIDVASVYMGSMSSGSYASRWGCEPPIVPRIKSRDAARDTVRMARELVQDGVRQS